MERTFNQNYLKFYINQQKVATFFLGTIRIIEAYIRETCFKTASCFSSGTVFLPLQESILIMGCLQENHITNRLKKEKITLFA